MKNMLKNMAKNLHKSVRCATFVLPNIDCSFNQDIFSKYAICAYPLIDLVHSMDNQCLATLKGVRSLCIYTITNKTFDQVMPNTEKVLREAHSVPTANVEPTSQANHVSTSNQAAKLESCGSRGTSCANLNLKSKSMKGFIQAVLFLALLFIGCCLIGASESGSSTFVSLLLLGSVVALMYKAGMFNTLNR
jgi:hypothetical protein